MILSIDNKKPTPEEIKEIRETVCMNCKSEFSPHDPRIIFVKTNKKLLWWHGLDKSKDGSEYLCKSFPKRKNTPVKMVKTCPNCKKIFKSDIRKFCAWSCERAYYKRLFPS